jgi:hypothetical protein
MAEDWSDEVMMGYLSTDDFSRKGAKSAKFGAMRKDFLQL